ncbi:MAG: hypothetical protein Q8914_05045 [Bacteroidota bacterium]|nr:hypothetical protein [Bacteroidota bacterium]
MTVAEATNLYERIIGQIVHYNLKEAFVNLSYLIQQNGFGLAYDQLSELESNYRYLLRFRLEGTPDPGKEKVYADLRRRALHLTDEAWHLWMSMRSPQLYYDRIRASKIESDVPMENLVPDLKKSANNLVLAQMVESTEARVEKIDQLTRLREHTVRHLFIKLFISGDWTEEDVPFYRSLFTDPAIFDPEKALFVSALLLSLMQRFDEEKILLLIDLCSNTEPEVSQRAIVAVAVIMYLYDERLDVYPAIGQKMALAMEDDLFKQSMIRVIFQLIRSKDTESVTKRMQEEILPEMTRFGSVIQDKLKQEDGDDSKEDFNPDWKNMIESSGFSAKMQEFSDMQMEGIDVYMSTFSGQKFYPFFQEIANWFLPFYTTHSSLKELFEKGSIAGSGILDMVLKSEYLCSSDKYSFCFNILQLPATYRKSMAANLGADGEVYEEYKKSEIAMNPLYMQEQASNRYIQDLYRFFNLYGRRRDFTNIFSFPLDIHNTKSLGKYFATEATLRKIGQLFFRNKHYKNALSVIDRLINILPADAELLQKRGFCLQQLDRRKEALETYLQADLILPDSLWTLKRIAACYRLEKNPAKALEYYFKAEKLAPDDLVLTFNIGHALVESGNYAEALKHYFKAEVLSDESLKTWRPIAWCSLMCGKMDQATNYYDKILKHNPAIDDYLNAGHLEWCKGYPIKAIDMYKRGIRATHTPFPEFQEMFQKDVKLLIGHGINEEDIPFVRDELIYALEE